MGFLVLGVRMDLVSAVAFTGFVAAASAQSYDLITAAKEEGALTTMALAGEWCGYGDIVDAFEAKYGIEVTDLDPGASSVDQLEALRAAKGDKDAAAPDVVDVTLAVAAEAQAEGLTEPYRVATWDSIPDGVKDPDAHWYGDYYGVIAFEVNTDVVKSRPEDWKDLLAADYAKAVALAGDPRTSAQAVRGVVAAGLPAADGDLTKAATAGLGYFADLNAAGNFVPVTGGVATLSDKTTPIVLRWDYLALRDRDALKADVPVDVIVPKTGVLGGAFAQAISAHAAHPNAAKLWMEYLYSDDGQLAFLKGYCHPIRFDSLVAEDRIPEDLKATMPPPEAYEGVVFPTAADLASAAATIGDQWSTTVGAEVSQQERR